MRKAAPSLMITLAITLIAASPAQAEIAWQTNLRAAHAQAQREGKLLLLHFYTDNCTWCEKLEQGAFQQPSVGETINSSFVAVKVDAEKSDKLAEMFKVTKFPTDVVVTTDGKTLSHSVSPQSPDRYVAMLQGAAAAVSNATQAPASAIAAGPTPETPSAVTASAAAQKPTTETFAARLFQRRQRLFQRRQRGFDASYEQIGRDHSGATHRVARAIDANANERSHPVSNRRLGI